MKGISTIVDRSPNLSNGPAVVINDWNDTVNQKGSVRQAPKGETMKIILTRLVIPREQRSIEERLYTRVNQLLYQATLKSTATIVPLGKNNPPLASIQQLNDDKSLSQFYDYKTTPTHVSGLLKFCIPSNQSFRSWRIAQPHLITYMKEQKIVWTSTTIDSIDTRSPLFIYNIPTTGIDIQCFQEMLVAQCNIQCPIALRVRDIAEQQTKAPCILVECDKADVYHVTTSIFLGLNSPMKQDAYYAHPISRAKPMTLSAGVSVYPTSTKECRIAALTRQRTLMNNQVRLAFVNVQSIDQPLLFNNESLLLRSIIFDRLTIEGQKTIHGIVFTTPNRILISMDRIRQPETLKKLEDLFSYLSQLGQLELTKITGCQDRPRRPNDPYAVDPRAQGCIESLQDPQMQPASPTPLTTTTGIGTMPGQSMTPTQTLTHNVAPPNLSALDQDKVQDNKIPHQQPTRWRSTPKKRSESKKKSTREPRPTPPLNNDGVQCPPQPTLADGTVESHQATSTAAPESNTPMGADVTPPSSLDITNARSVLLQILQFPNTPIDYLGPDRP